MSDELNKSNNELNKKKPSHLRANSKIDGRVIKKVYFSNDDKNYIIFKAEEDEDITFLGSEQPTMIEHLLAECKFLISSSNLDKESKEMFDYQIAVAINCFMLGEIENSKKILELIVEKLHNKMILKKKLWYIGVFLFVTLFMICFSMSFDNFKYIKYFKIATFGAIGGFISLNIKLEEIKFEISESKASYIIVSIYKVMFSMLTSIVSYFLIESELVLGVIKSNSSNSLYFIYAIATLAGFSESLLPNIFKSIENKATKEEKKDSNV